MVVVFASIISKYKLFLLLFFALTIIFSITSTPVQAESNENISWSSSQPTVYSSTITPFLGQGICQGFYQYRDIVGENEPKRSCITTDDKVSFGIYYSSNSFAYTPAVSFSLDSKMYKLNGACYNYDDCLYLPDEDTLVAKRYLTNNSSVRTVVVYKNFKNRLKKTFNLSNLSTEYNFNAANPEYIFQDITGYAWQVGGFGASKNGKWLAIEFKSRGIYVLNIETLQMRRILVMGNSYDQGMDPAFEFAVSNDGEHLAFMGRNVGLSVYDIPKTCGDIVTDINTVNMGPFVVNCKKSDINVTAFITGFRDAYRPYFSDDGGELNFSATSNSWETRQVSLRVGNYVSKMIDYLALGDSYSSGEGESDDKYYLAGTNDEYEKCHVSSRSYPFVIADLLSINPARVKSVACSGATTEDVVGNSDANYSGQSNRLSSKGLNLTKEEKAASQIQAKKLFIPGRIYQESFIKIYSPKVITIGIGGNDAGLMGKLRQCISPGTCDAAKTEKGKEQTATEIKNLYGTLVKTYQELHIASPNSKIYAIGYPKIINASNDCDLINGLLLDKTERQFMNEGIIYLNQIIKAAALTVGIGYADTQESFADHVLCGTSSPIAMNAIRLGDDSPIIDGFDQIKFIGNESFHPNSIGHSYLANAIIKSVGNILNDAYCVNNVVVCPIETPAPEPSSYWIPAEHHNYPTQKMTNIIFDREDAVNNLQKRILVTDYSFSPSSNVDVELTSTPILLGNFTTTDSGALNIDVILPSDIEEGYHTIHLYGTSFSGESIELYQIIEYKKPVTIVKNVDQTISSVSKATNTVETATTSVNSIGNTSDNLALATNDNNGEVRGLSISTDNSIPKMPSSVESINQTKQTQIPTGNQWKNIAIIFSSVIIAAALVVVIRKLIHIL